MQNNTSAGLLVWAGLVLSMFCSAICGIDMAFNVYAVLLKESFNFTQAQVELTASMGTIGLGLSFLETIITEWFGYRATFVLCWILMPLGAGSMSLAALYKDVFAGLPVFIYAGQFMMSVGDSVAHMAIVRINIERFSSQHSGKILGIFLAMCSVGKIIFGILVDFLFPLDLAGFFFTLSMTSLAVFGVCFIVLHLEFRRLCKISSSVELKGLLQSKKDQFVPNSSVGNGKPLTETHHGLCYSQEEDHKQFTSNFSKKTYNDELKSPDNGETPPSLSKDGAATTKVMLKSLSFHLTFWPSVLFYAISFTCINNITSVAVSAGTDNVLNTVYVSSFSVLATRILFGLIFDKYPALLGGVALMSVSYVCFAAAMLVGMFAFNGRTVYMVTVLSGIGMGPGMTIPIALLMVLFGKSNYGKVTVAFWGLFSLFQLLTQVLVGVAYDSQSSGQQAGQVNCYGNKCFFWSFALMLVIAIVLFISQWLNYVLNRKTKDAD